MHVLRRRRLALELHHQRVLAGLTGSEVAARMDCSASKISRIETGRVPIAPRDARELARIYGLAPDRQEQLAQLARDARRTGWWEAYGDLLKPEQVWFLGLESAAARLRIFEVGVIPGLLQTTDYARAIIDAALLGLPGPELSRLVQITGSRQSVLTRRSPATVAAIMDEAAIRRQVGGPQVMRAQLTHLLAVAHAPNVDLQILPFSAGAGPSAGRPFVLLSFADPADGDFAFVHGQVTSTCIDEPAGTGKYRQFFDRLSQMSLSPAGSAILISSILAGQRG
jgi:transcriptional regulator with XRE-family HTH domain